MINMMEFYEMNKKKYTIGHLSRLFGVGKSTMVRWCSSSHRTPYTVVLIINNWDTCGPVIRAALRSRGLPQKNPTKITAQMQKDYDDYLLGGRVKINKEADRAQRKKRADKSLAQSRAKAKKRNENKAARNAAKDEPSFL